jgi:cation transport regulator ChaC
VTGARAVHIQLRQGQAAIFGYGSLLSRASMEQSLGRQYHGPFVAAELEGWERDWTVAMPNHTGFYAEIDGNRIAPAQIIYLNVRARRDALINGVLFVVDPGELRRFDDREWIYSRERVNDAVRGVEVSGGDVWLYVGLSEYLCDHHATAHQRAIRRTYLNIVEGALVEWGEDFRARYVASSQPLPEHLVIADERPGVDGPLNATMPGRSTAR